MSELTGKQLAWADAYLKTYNKTEASRQAGYKGNDVTLAAIGYENFKKPQIQDYIKQRLTEKAMSADEVLARLASMGRSDIVDFADVRRIADLKKDEYIGKTHVIKKFKSKLTTDALGRQVEEVELELYGADSALEKVGKYHNIFKETHTNLNYDLSKATDEQLQRIAAGEDPASVLQQNTATGAG